MPTISVSNLSLEYREAAEQNCAGHSRFEVLSFRDAEKVGVVISLNVEKFPGVAQVKELQNQLMGLWTRTRSLPEPEKISPFFSDADSQSPTLGPLSVDNGVMNETTAKNPSQEV